MTVLRTEWRDQQVCDLCGSGDLGAYHVCYRLMPPHNNDVDDPEWGTRICSDCCLRHRKGRMADMIQVAAIAEFQALGNPSETFVRELSSVTPCATRKPSHGIGLAVIPPKVKKDA
jgi:hypothetical protein